jgi:hypothetical protein
MKGSLFWDINLYDTVKVDRSLGRIAPPSSGLKSMSSKKRALLVACILLVSCLAYYSALKVGAICSSETSDDFHSVTPRRQNSLNVFPSVHFKTSHSLRIQMCINSFANFMLRSDVLLSSVVTNVTLCSLVSLVLAPALSEL